MSVIFHMPLPVQQTIMTPVKTLKTSETAQNPLFYSNCKSLLDEFYSFYSTG